MRHLWYARPESAAPKTVSAMRRASLAFNVGGMRSSCRLTQHPLLGRSRPGLLFLRKLRQKSPVPPLRGKPTAWLYLAAIPPHLRRGLPRRKCSGRPGSSRSGCWRRQCRDSATLHPPQTAPEPQCQAAYAAANVVPLFGQVSRPGSVRGGRLSTLRVRSPPLHCSALTGSAVFRSRAQPPPRHQTASPDTLHFVPRPMALPDS